MKKLFYLLLLFLFPCFAMTQSTTNLMSFNIRFANPDDGFNYWPNRKDLVASMIRYHDVDIVGLQEALRSQLDDLSELLPGYKWVGLCRTDGTTTPDPDNEFSAILYRADRYEMLDGATFWLSEEPEKVGSKSWDSSLPRVVTWTQFKEKTTGNTFYHFNTHFDHRGVEARANSAKLIKKKIAEIAKDAPVVLTGDFNCLPTDEPYLILTNKEDKIRLDDALFVSQMPHHGPLGTWTNSFQFPGVPGRRIDFIFVNKQIAVLKHGILSDSWSGRLPSDHLPVLTKIMFK